jgi:hypothetical protein
MAHDKNKKRKPEQKQAAVQTPAPVALEPIVGPPWLAAALTLFAGVIFVLTTCRTVPGGDSGEIISVSYNLGVAHPPGYPTLTMLGHLFTYLPFGSIAFRVNLMSGLFGVLSGYMIYLIAVRWLRDRWLGVAAAALFIFSPLAWRYAVVAEVFTLNNFMIAALLYASLRFLEEPGPKRAMIWTFTLGLACSHHHTILFLAVPIFLMLVWQHPKLLLAPKTVLACFGVFMVPMLTYLYLPWAGKKNLLISWGQVDSWDGFWTHFLRKEYGTFQLATGDTDYLNMFTNLKYYAMDIWLQMLIAGGFCALFGLWLAVKGELRRDKFARLLLWGFVTYVILFHLMANMDMSNRLFFDVQSRFWLLPNLILSLFFAAGIKHALARRPEWAGRGRIAVALAVVVLQVSIHYKREDHSRNTVFYDLGKGLLDGLPQGALAFQRGDVYVNSVRYLQSVERYRTDVMSIPFDLLWWPWSRAMIEANFPAIRFPGRVYRYVRTNMGEYTLKEFFELNQAKFPSFIGKLSQTEIANITEKFELIPVGFFNRIVPKGTPFNFKEFVTYAEGFRSLIPPKKEEMREKSWEAFIYYNYWDREMEKARILFEQAMRSGENLEMMMYGANILERTIREYAEPPPSAFRNLGVAYQYMSRRDPAYAPKMVAAWQAYLQTNPTDDPQLPTIQRAVQTGQPGTLAPPAPVAPTPSLGVPDPTGAPKR